MCHLICHGALGLTTSNSNFSLANFTMTQFALPAPFETYVHVFCCRSGEEFFREIKNDDILDLETQMKIAIKDHSGYCVWELWDGPEEIDYFKGAADNLGHVIEQIIQKRSENARSYFETN